MNNINMSMKRNNHFDFTWFFRLKLYLRTHDLTFKTWWQLTKYYAFSFKSITTKIFVFLLCAVILIPISLHLEQWALSITPEQVKQASNNIIGVQPIGNPGIEFSFLSNTPVWVVFFIESITIILSVICLLIVSDKLYFLIPISFCLIGGIMNCDSRASVNEYVYGSYYYLEHFLNPTSYHYANYGVVIDYWYFHTGSSYAIFNLNDTLVISGGSGFVVFLFIDFLYIYYPTFVSPKKYKDVSREFRY